MLVGVGVGVLVGVAVGVPGPGVGVGVGVLVGVAVGVPGPGVGVGVGVAVGVAVGVPGPGVGVGLGVGEGVGVLVGVTRGSIVGVGVGVAVGVLVGVGVAVGTGNVDDPGGDRTLISFTCNTLPLIPEMALHTIRMLDAYIGTVMRCTTLSVLLDCNASFLEYMMLHSSRSHVLPRTLHVASDAELSAVRIMIACTYTLSGMSSWIHAPVSWPKPDTLLVTPVTPSIAMPSLNSSPEVHAES